MNIFFRLVYFGLPVTHSSFGKKEALSDHNYKMSPSSLHDTIKVPHIHRLIPHILHKQQEILALAMMSFKKMDIQ